MCAMPGTPFKHLMSECGSKRRPARMSRQAPRGAPAWCADQTDGVIEQSLVSARQVVLALPGACGVKVMVAPESTAAESIVPVMLLHALYAGAGKSEKLLVTATTA